MPNNLSVDLDVFDKIRNKQIKPAPRVSAVDFGLPPEFDGMSDDEITSLVQEAMAPPPTNPLFDGIKSAGRGALEIGKGLAQETRNNLSSIGQPVAPFNPDVLQAPPTAVQKLGNIARNAFPVTQATNKFLDAPGGNPVSRYFKESPFTVPTRNVLQAGAVGVDALTGLTNTFIEGLRHTFGKQDTSFLTKVQQSQQTDRSPGTLNFNKKLAEADGIIEQMKAQGVPSEQIQKELQSQLFRAGLDGDLAEIFAGEIAFGGIGAGLNSFRKLQRGKKATALRTARNETAELNKGMEAFSTPEAPKPVEAPRLGYDNVIKQGPPPGTPKTFSTEPQNIIEKSAVGPGTRNVAKPVFDTPLAPNNVDELVPSQLKPEDFADVPKKDATHSKPKAKAVLSAEEKKAMIAERQAASKAFTDKRFKGVDPKKARETVIAERAEARKVKKLQEKRKAILESGGGSDELLGIDSELRALGKAKAERLRKTVKEKNIIELIDDALGGKSGQADFRVGKGKENPAKVEARRELKRRSAIAVANARDRGISLAKYLKENTKMTPQQIRAVTEFSKTLTEADIKKAGVRVGNIQLDKLMNEGKIERSVGEKIKKAGREIERELDTSAISDVERKLAVGDPSGAKALDELLALDDDVASAIGDIPIAKAGAIVKEAIASGKGYKSAIEEVQDAVAQYNAIGKILARNLRARQVPASVDDLSASLKKLLKSGKLTEEEASRAEEVIRTIDGPKKTIFRKLWDPFHEYSINAMLSAPVTAARNVLGMTAEVFVKQPADRLARATLTKILPKSLVKNPAYFRGALAELKAIYGSIPQSARLAKRFFVKENTNGVIRSIGKRIEKLNEKISKLPPDSKQHEVYAKKIRQLVRDRFDVLQSKVGSRTDEVFRGDSRVIPGKVGYAINTPVRGIVAADAGFFNTSFKGHLAAEKVAEAIRQNKKVGDLADIKLTKGQIAQAREDAFVYLYRQKIGDGFFGKLLTDISRTPILNNLFPFIKTRTNILRTHLERSPFGLIKEVAKTAKSKGVVDAKSAARVISGNLMLLGMYAITKKHNGKFIAPSDDAKEREQRRGLGRPEVGIEFPDGTMINTASVSPMSEMVAMLAAYEKYGADTKVLGAPKAEALRESSQAYMQSVIENAMFSDIKMMQNMNRSLFGKSSDPESTVGNKASKEISKLIAGRIVPNITRETVQSGKLLGTIPTGKKDKTLLDVQSNNPLTATYNQIKFDLGLSKGLPRRVNELTGGDAERLDRYSPLNPKFYTQKGKVVGKDITAMEKRVREELLRTKSGRGPAQDNTKGIKLSRQEVADMARYVARGPEGLPPLLNTLDKTITKLDNKGVTDKYERSRILERVMSEYSKLGYRRARHQAIKRLKTTLEGRKTLWERAYDGKKPFVDDPKELQKAIIRKLL